MFNNLILVAGHWLSPEWEPDNGASYDLLTERELTVKICTKLISLLNNNINIANLHWIWIKERLSLNNKIKDVNSINVDNWNTIENTLLLSIHINAWWWEWIECFSYKRWEEWKKIWDTLLSSINNKTGQKIRGAKYENESQYDTLWIVHDTIGCTSILIECWFIDNDNDRYILENRIDDIVIWLYNWIAELCWLEKYQEEVTLKKTDSEKFIDRWYIKEPDANTLASKEFIYTLMERILKRNNLK